MKKAIILGHENPDVDSVVSGYLLEKILTKKGYDVEFIIPDKKIDSDTLDICMRNGLNPLNFRKKLDLKQQKSHSREFIRELDFSLFCFLNLPRKNYLLLLVHMVSLLW